MSEGVRKKIVYATLPLAVIWALFNLSETTTPPPVEAPATIAPVVALPQPTGADPRLIDVEEHQTLEWGQDPFRSYTYRTSAAPAETARLEWQLAGIIFNPDNPLAFINRKSVRIGDKIGEATVVAITKKAVVLDHRGKQITLSLDKG